jgi:hypothetical protein
VSSLRDFGLEGVYIRRFRCALPTVNKVSSLRDLLIYNNLQLSLTAMVKDYAEQRILFAFRFKKSCIFTKS